MNRRGFLQNSAAISAFSLLPMNQILANKQGLDSIGIQLFSLPLMLEKDFDGTIQWLSQIGYRKVELFGPYSFSAVSARERWKSLEPRLGFGGSGFFGNTAEKAYSIFNNHGIIVPAAHTDIETLKTAMDALGAAGEIVGFEYVVLPSLSEVAEKNNLDDYKRIADDFNQIGENARKAGLKFAYHNHGFGLKEEGEHIPLNVILDRTDPDLVFMEMDVYWTTAGGADPVEYLKAYPNRYRLMHVKDMKEKVHFSGDGAEPAQWMELFPYITNAGDGVLDLKTIISTAKEAGVEHFFVEQDMVEDPRIALKTSFEYLKTL